MGLLAMRIRQDNENACMRQAWRLRRNVGVRWPAHCILDGGEGRKGIDPGSEPHPSMPSLLPWGSGDSTDYELL